MKKPLDQIEDWKEMLNWSVDEVANFLKLTPDNLVQNWKYQNTEPVAYLDNKEIFPGLFIFFQKSLILIKVSFYTKLTSELPDDMNIPPYGPPSAELNSRAGKTFTQYVWPEQGFSIATNHHEIGFIEVFHPTTIEDYKAKFWTDPEWHKKFNK